MPEKNYVREAEDALRAKREASAAEYDKRRSEVWEKVPGVREIDAQLSRTGADILSVIMSGFDVDNRVGEIRKSNELLQKKKEELLVGGGYPADYTKLRFDCEACGDSGYVGINMCTCMKTAVAKLRLSDSELGRLADKQSFESFDTGFYATGEELDCIMWILKRLRHFADNFTKETADSWLLLGNTGLGKTHLSTAVGVAVIKRGYDVVYKTVQAMIDDFEDVQFKGKSSELTRGYYDCDLLIIDDLGSELTNQFTVSCIYNVINARMNKQKATIISTNLTQAELRDRYADRITSRLFGEYIPLVFKGRDIRRQKLMRGRVK